jgi:hypothetical protein
MRKKRTPVPLAAAEDRDERVIERTADRALRELDRGLLEVAKVDERPTQG